MRFGYSGVPKLKRSEIEAACEDFSNVIGSCPIGTLFKGTLSSGVEIAVASVATASAKEWTNNIEMQFRKKVFSVNQFLIFLIDFDSYCLIVYVLGNFRSKCYPR